MPETDKIAIAARRLLLVEGIDETCFLAGLANRTMGVADPLKKGPEGRVEYALFDDIQVLPLGGKTKLSATLKMLKRAPGFASVLSIGVIRDADSDAAEAWKTVCSALGKAELSAPPAPGTFASGNPRVGVLILPGNGKPGMLESVCVESVSSGPEMQCVGAYFACLQGKRVSLPTNMDKANAHAFLAACLEPDKRVGEAALAGYWPFDSAAFDGIKDFLRELAK